MADRLQTGAAVVCWFVLNICIGNLNGLILKKYGFGYPVFLTVVHMICCWALSAVSLLFCMRPVDPTPASAHAIQKVRTLSIAFCASVACGNIALRYIYVSFAQMVTAASPLFTIMLMYTMAEKVSTLRVPEPSCSFLIAGHPKQFCVSLFHAP